MLNAKCEQKVLHVEPISHSQINNNFSTQVIETGR